MRVAKLVYPTSVETPENRSNRQNLTTCASRDEVVVDVYRRRAPASNVSFFYRLWCEKRSRDDFLYVLAVSTVSSTRYDTVKMTSRLAEYRFRAPFVLTHRRVLCGRRS